MLLVCLARAGVGALLGAGGAGAKVHVGGADGKGGRKRDRDLTDAELDARELVRWQSAVADAALR